MRGSPGCGEAGGFEGIREMSAARTGEAREMMCLWTRNLTLSLETRTRFESLLSKGADARIIGNSERQKRVCRK